MMGTLPQMRRHLARTLLRRPTREVTSWQSQQVSGTSYGDTYEIENAFFTVPIPDDPEDLRLKWRPNLPWAEDHFLERVSGEPLNPPPSEAYWPFAQSGNAAHKEGEKFSHTYPERFWPIGATDQPLADNEVQCNFGIRYQYGDLDDVCYLLSKDPTTRQAFLPVWFPEDTGNVPNVRVPCTLGYHFRFDQEMKLNVTYLIRSCDFIRHWTDDCYMAARLGQWVLEQTGRRSGDRDRLDWKIGTLTFHAMSLHAFAPDYGILTKWANEDTNDYGALTR